VLLIAMIFGLAALNAVLAQGAFKVQDLSNQQITLTQQNGELRREIDDLTSPARLTGVAAKDGLIFPDTNAIQVVHAGNTSGTAASSGHRHQTGTANSPANSASRPDGTASPTGLPGGPE
jgi:hypothetical protein